MLFIVNTAKSQGFIGRGSGIKYSLGAETGLAVNYLAKNYNAVAGLSVQVDFPILDGQLFATVNSGFNNVFLKSTSVEYEDDMQVIPIKAGLKYFLKNSFYAQGDMGVSFLLNKTFCLEGKQAALVLAPQVGMMIPVNHINCVDIGFRFEATGKFYACDKQNNIVSLRIAWAYAM